MGSMSCFFFLSLDLCVYFPESRRALYAPVLPASKTQMYSAGVGRKAATLRLAWN